MSKAKTDPYVHFFGDMKNAPEGYRPPYGMVEVNWFKGRYGWTFGYLWCGRPGMPDRLWSVEAGSFVRPEDATLRPEDQS